MNVLLIGSGGREHALAWKLKQSPKVTNLFCAPGNAGIEQITECVPINMNEIDKLIKFAQKEKIDLTVVGPEQPLIEGIVDSFEKNGLTIFGPSKLAAEIEGSKVFAKHFMKKYKIPTANFRSFDASQMEEAVEFISHLPPPIVVKADGLAAGKGVVVCESQDRARQTLDAMMKEKIFGDAGTKVVIEECLTGEEISILALTDGKEFVLLPPAQDHKRIFDNDQGKNTGGMGAYAPVPFVKLSMLETIKRTIIKPTLQGLAKEGRTYKGCLYAGLMLTENGPKVIEFNCRFGDPETQVVLPLLDADLFDIMMQISSGKLGTKKISWKQQSAVCVVLASGGYPDAYETGKEIIGLENIKDPDVVVFHSGTKKEKKNIITKGGRVLGVTALGQKDDLESVIDKAYRAVEKITFDGAYYRSDIGKKALHYLQEQQTGIV
jgi:phosphoribosylamine--glycine ligase